MKEYTPSKLESYELIKQELLKADFSSLIPFTGISFPAGYRQLDSPASVIADFAVRKYHQPDKKSVFIIAAPPGSGKTHFLKKTDEVLNTLAIRSDSLHWDRFAFVRAKRLFDKPGPYELYDQKVISAANGIILPAIFKHLFIKNNQQLKMELPLSGYYQKNEALGRPLAYEVLKYLLEAKGVFHYVKDFYSVNVLALIGGPIIYRLYSQYRETIKNMSSWEEAIDYSLKIGVDPPTKEQWLALKASATRNRVLEINDLTVNAAVKIGIATETTNNISNESMFRMLQSKSEFINAGLPISSTNLINDLKNDFQRAGVIVKAIGSIKPALPDPVNIAIGYNNPFNNSRYKLI